MVRKAKPTTELPEEHPGGGHIVVTAQQSRYALDAVDAPASKEVRPPTHPTPQPTSSHA
jgi:ATP-binding cassette subfamily F protein 3